MLEALLSQFPLAFIPVKDQTGDHPLLGVEDLEQPRIRKRTHRIFRLKPGNHRHGGVVAVLGQVGSQLVKRHKGILIVGG